MVVSALSGIPSVRLAMSKASNILLTMGLHSLTPIRCLRTGFLCIERISTGRIALLVIHRALQCDDAVGPMMSPDVFNGEDAGWWAAEYLSQEYNIAFLPHPTV
jgi:hypothetical protein